METEHVRLRSSLAPQDATESVRWLQETRDVLAATLLPCAFDGGHGKFNVTIVDKAELSQLGLLSTTTSAVFDSHSDPSTPAQPELVWTDADQQSLGAAFGAYMVSRCYPGAPAWLTHGIAEFVSTVHAVSTYNPANPAVPDRTVVIGTPPYWLVSDVEAFDETPEPALRVWDLHLKQQRSAEPGVIGAIGLWELPSLHRLRSQTPEHFEALSLGRTTTLNRAAAWRLVQYLSLGPVGIRKKFGHFLQMLQHGDETAWDAWRLVFSDDAWFDANQITGEGLEVRLPYVEPRRDALVTRALTHQEWLLHLATVGVSASRSQLNGRLARLEALAQDPRYSARAREMRAFLLDDSGAAKAELQAALEKHPDDTGLLTLLVFHSVLAQPAKQSLSAPELIDAANRLRSSGTTWRHDAAVAAFDLARGEYLLSAREATNAIARERGLYFAWEVRSDALSALGCGEAALRSNRRALAFVSPYAEDAVMRLKRRRDELGERLTPLAAGIAPSACTEFDKEPAVSELHSE